MKLCYEICVYYSQEIGRDMSLKCKALVMAFYKIVETPETFPWTLSVLHQVSVLLQSYGQHNMKANILRALQRHSYSIQPRQWAVVGKTLEILVATADWENVDREQYVNSARDVYLAAKEVTNATSPLAVSARYNQAWILLEADRFRDALDIHSNEQAICESAYGRWAPESINWTATRARAHFKNGDFDTTEALMEETVLVRADRVYGQNHPMYWEARYRSGLWLLTMAERKSRPHRVHDDWARGENIVKQTLEWRCEILGPDNPQTTNAYRWLKYFYEVQKKDTSDIVAIVDKYRLSQEA